MTPVNESDKTLPVHGLLVRGEFLIRMEISGVLITWFVEMKRLHPSKSVAFCAFDGDAPQRHIHRGPPLQKHQLPGEDDLEIVRRQVLMGERS